MILRQALFVTLLVAIVAASVDPLLLQVPFVDRVAYGRALSTLPDRQWPDYPRFLEEVRSRTRPGDTVAILVPAARWDYGYSYAYYRASYFLTGRVVMPLVDPQDRRLPENLRAARYVAAFGMSPRVAADVVWRGDGGTLVRLPR